MRFVVLQFISRVCIVIFWADAWEELADGCPHSRVFVTLLSFRALFCVLETETVSSLPVLCSSVSCLSFPLGRSALRNDLLKK